MHNKTSNAKKNQQNTTIMTNFDSYTKKKKLF